MIQHEKPELEVQKSQLLKQEEELKIELAKLEEALLEVRKILSTKYNIKINNTQYMKEINVFKHLKYTIQENTF